MPAKERGAILTIHQSFYRGEGVDKDSQRRHIINPAGFYTSQQAIHASNRDYRTDRI
jgi:hypothetical protein